MAASSCTGARDTCPAPHDLPYQPGAPPRVALSWGLADGAFEAPAFDLAAHGPFPPLQVHPWGRCRGAASRCVAVGGQGVPY